MPERRPQPQEVMAAKKQAESEALELLRELAERKAEERNRPHPGEQH